MLDEEPQDLKGLMGQLDPPPLLPQFVGLEVDLEDTEAKRSATGIGRHGLFNVGR